MAVDYQELNGVVSAVHASVSNVTEVIEQLMQTVGTYYAVLNLANTFLSVPLHSDKIIFYDFKWPRMELLSVAPGLAI